MFAGFSVPEILIVLAVLTILFGAGPITRIVKELASGNRLFKQGSHELDDVEDKEKIKLFVFLNN
jgi:prepilin-type N-terminal cleavage/methylation domain-containing protein